WREPFEVSSSGLPGGVDRAARQGGMPFYPLPMDFAGSERELSRPRVRRNAAIGCKRCVAWRKKPCMSCISRGEGHPRGRFGGRPD
ncbi:MAG: hypothetical protein, partial [Olavius algarvensis Gamma 1 endosymbiont]